MPRIEVLGVLLLLSACTTVQLEGTDAQGYKWVRDGVQVASGNWRYHMVTDGNVFLHCANLTASVACSRIERDGSACDIYLANDSAPWVRAHEEKHCAGWRHPGDLWSQTRALRRAGS